jgi:hypothetical protein
MGKNNIPVKKPASAADFRKADIASTAAFNKAAGVNAPAFPTALPATAGLSGFGMNDLAAAFKALGLTGSGGGGGGGGMSAADRAQLALERRKLRASNRQFGQEMAFKQQQFAEQQKQYADEQQTAKDALLRKQTGLGDYIASLTGQINKGPDLSNLTNTLNSLATQAKASIGSSYDAMAQALSGIANPFAGYQAQGVSSPTAGLEQFLASQGTGADDLTRFAQLQQAQSQQQAQAANNLMAQLGGLFTGAQQSRQAEMAQGKTADLGTLALNQMLANANIQEQGKSDMDKLRELLLQAQLQKAGL